MTDNIEKEQTQPEKMEVEVSKPVVTSKDHILTDMKEANSLLQRGVETKEMRFIVRVSKSIVPLRRLIQEENKSKEGGSRATLRECILTCSEANKLPKQLFDLKEILEFGDIAVSEAPILPETEVFYRLLTVLHFLDENEIGKGYELAENVVQKCFDFNRRTLDQLTAKAVYFYARLAELKGCFSEIRSYLHELLQTATLRHNTETRATVLNAILRSYTLDRLHSQADKLISKTSFPEGATAHQLARYLYFVGLIKAFKLEYSDSFIQLQQALRKTPLAPHIGRGFKAVIMKSIVIVQLLMGDTPDKKELVSDLYRVPLAPYVELVKVVRQGDLDLFQQITTKYRALFTRDNLFSLIQRLRHNVIKMGLRKINLSYSRISFADIASRLRLENAHDVEYIVAKAVRDGVIDARIDHQQQYIQSFVAADIYATTEPQQAFAKRIDFCFQMHNDCVKAMRFSSTAHKAAFENAAKRKQRELEENELAKELSTDNE
eukprot:GCRY01002413.1.p1 GENE.GCRY01002413.1~~GCRY01002413.1.p1  ORF type:complete len:492 (+),score=126.34 GCRY01002413.1:160-1635(+)